MTKPAAATANAARDLPARRPSLLRCLCCSRRSRGLLGVLAILDGGTIQVGPTWEPTIDFGTTFGNLSQILLGGNQLQIVLSTTGSVQLDGLYVDPFLQY